MSEFKLPPLFYTWTVKRLPTGIFQANGRNRNNPAKGRHSLGTSDPDEAKRNLIKIDRKLAIRNGLAQADSTEQGVPAITVEDACKRFLEWTESRVAAGELEESSLKSYRIDLGTFRRYADEESMTLVNGLTDVFVNRYIGYLRSKFAPSTAAHRAERIPALIQFLIDRNLRPPTFRLNVKIAKSRKSTRYCYNSAQVRAILAHCREEERLHWLHTLVAILAYTGKRIGEALALRWTDIDFAAKRILLTDDRFDSDRRRDGSVRRTKSGKDRVIPMHHELVAILQNVTRHSHGFVVNNSAGERLTYKEARLGFINSVIEPLSSQFPTPEGRVRGFIDGRFHSFRHFFTSISHDLGIPERQLMAILGHTDRTMTDRYYHARTDVALDALEKLSLNS